MNHATVSRQLKTLEDSAGTRLFNRTPIGLTATEAGEEAIRRAAAIEAEVIALNVALAAADDSAEGPLTVTIPPLITGAGFAEDVAAFRSVYPRVELTVLGTNETLNLYKRDADVAIRVSHDPADGLWGRVATQQRAGWFATPEFVNSHPIDRPLPVISFTAYEENLPKTLQTQAPDAFVALKTDDMVSAFSMVRAGVGMARMPHALGHSAQDLVRVPGLDLVPYIPIWVLTHPDLRRVPRISAFMRIIAEGFAKRSDLFLGS